MGPTVITELSGAGAAGAAALERGSSCTSLLPQSLLPPSTEGVELDLWIP